MSSVARKGFFLGNKTQQFAEENLYILNELAKVYKPEIYKGYLRFITNFHVAKMYMDYGAEVGGGDGGGFMITITKKFIKKVQPLLDTPVPFENIILRCKDITYGNGSVSGRPFFRADGDSNTVTLSATTKGSDILINNIIFESKGLVIDQYQTIDSYTMISSDDDTLVLELNISNF